MHHPIGHDGFILNADPLKEKAYQSQSDNTYHDYEKALEYYEKAVKAGHTSAQAAYDRVKKLVEEA